MDPLAQPITINTTEVKNRFYMTAMHMNMCRDFEVTDQLVEFYAERARGGVGMITVGYATVDEYSGGGLCLGAHKDDFISGLSSGSTSGNILKGKTDSFTPKCRIGRLSRLSSLTFLPIIS